MMQDPSNKLAISDVEAKGSEVKASTAATLTCVVTGLTKVLESVTWQKPDSGGAITHDQEGYLIDEGTYQTDDRSQTTTLTVPANLNADDAVFTCVIRSDEHGKTADSQESTDVNSKVFSK